MTRKHYFVQVSSRIARIMLLHFNKESNYPDSEIKIKEYVICWWKRITSDKRPMMVERGFKIFQGNYVAGLSRCGIKR
jgi:hypothetical protein